MKTYLTSNRPTWLRVARWLSGVWSALIIGLVINAVAHAPSFEAAAEAPCGLFLIPLAEPIERTLQGIDPRLHLQVVRWQDRLSRKDITPFRYSGQALRCTVIESRAQLFLKRAHQGKIKPEVTVHKGRLVALIGIPCCLFIIGSYLILGRRKTITPQ